MKRFLIALLLTFGCSISALATDGKLFAPGGGNYRHGQRLLNGPAVSINSISKSFVFNPVNLAPFNQGARLALIFNHERCSPIANLLCCSCPMTIGQAIVPVIVNSINAEFLTGRLSHISNEVLNLMPLVANGDSASAVVDIGRLKFIVATRHHAPPYIVAARARQSMSPFGSAGNLALYFAQPATARGGAAPSKTALVYDSQVAASALAFPSPNRMVTVYARFGFTQNCQPRKLPAGQIVLSRFPSVFVEAPARANRVLNEVCPLDDLFSAAIAKTSPMNQRLLIRMGVGKDSQPVEFLAYQSRSVSYLSRV